MKDLAARWIPIALILIAWPADVSAQSVTVSAVGESLRIRASGFGVINGDTLDRLKNGRTVRVVFDLTVLPKPGDQPVVQSHQTFVLSYDLWEERFAVTQVGTPSRSISHLKSADAEAWCLERLTVPVSALGPLGRDAPFWIRLEYRVQDGDRASGAEDAAGYSLRGLIDVLSRRRKADELRDSIEAGPFRLTK